TTNGTDRARDRTAHRVVQARERVTRGAQRPGDAVRGIAPTRDAAVPGRVEVRQRVVVRVRVAVQRDWRTQLPEYRVARRKRGSRRVVPPRAHVDLAGRRVGDVTLEPDREGRALVRRGAERVVRGRTEHLVVRREVPRGVTVLVEAGEGNR